MNIENNYRFQHNDYNFFISYDKPKVQTKEEIKEKYKKCFEKDYFIRKKRILDIK